jgi:tRNA dimethylallyltransferase
VAATGRPLSDWQNEPTIAPDKSFRVVVIEPPRDELYRKCDSRFLDMIDAGAIDEAKALAARADTEELNPALPIFRALGYPPLAAYLRGETELDAAIITSQQQTRNYAKRQTTWLRHQLPWDDGDHPRISILKYNYSIDDKLFSFLS